MSIKDLIVTKEEEIKLKARDTRRIVGKCRYCKQDVRNNIMLVKIKAGNSTRFIHSYCAIREMKRIKEGLIFADPLMIVVKF